MKNIIILVLSIVLMASCASSNRLTTRIRYATETANIAFMEAISITMPIIVVP